MGRNCLRHAMTFMAAAAALVSGCAMANFGSIRSNADVTRQFEAAPGSISPVWHPRRPHC